MRMPYKYIPEKAAELDIYQGIIIMIPEPWSKA
jgi:hypothetical protein